MSQIMATPAVSEQQSHFAHITNFVQQQASLGA